MVEKSGKVPQQVPFSIGIGLERYVIANRVDRLHAALQRALGHVQKFLRYIVFKGPLNLNNLDWWWMDKITIEWMVTPNLVNDSIFVARTIQTYLRRK